jgi:inosine-uridine nucleoside N-ribohydrolase
VRPILFDTDIGSDCDDALTLGVALAEHRALEFVAVTTGSAKSDRRAEIVGSRLQLAGPLAKAMARQVELWAPVQRKLFTFAGGEVADDNVAFLHDPLTVLALVDDSAFEFETLSILPTIVEGVLRTIEAEPSWGVGAQMRVATRVDANAARDPILQRLLQT